MIDLFRLGHVADEAGRRASPTASRSWSTSRWPSCPSRGLVLLDEPCAGVNPALVERLRELLLELNSAQGGSFVVIEHNMDFVMDLCQRVVCMVEGKVLADGHARARCSRNPAVLRGLPWTIEVRRRRRRLLGDVHDPERASASRRSAARSRCCIGPNGAGKSTVLKTLFGLLGPRAGRHPARRQSITGTPPRRTARARRRFVPQGRNLFGSLSVLQNLELGGITLAHRKTAARAHRRGARAVPAHPGAAAEPGSTLSGGEQKQLEVGRALLLRPRVLLIDEPSIGLSPLVAQDVFKLLRRLADAGTTVLMVEQNVRSALAYADRALRAGNGAPRRSTGRRAHC